MSNAELPNADPRVTPDWKPYPFPKTNFLDAIKTSPIEGFDGERFAGYVPIDWCASGGRAVAAHGGYCAAVFMATARQYCEIKYGNRGLTDPIHLHIDYLQPLPQGAFHVLVKALHSGNRLATLRIELVSSKSQRNDMYSVGLIRMVNLVEMEGSRSLQPVSGRLPNRDTECGRLTDANFFYGNPPASTIRVLCPNDGEDISWSPSFGGQNTRYQWTKLDDGSLFQLDHVALIVDLIPNIPLNYERHKLKAAVKYRMPTLSLQLTFFSKVSNAEWLLTKTTMQKLHNGLFDTTIQVMDESGSIIATSNQLNSIIPRELKRRGSKAVL